MPTPWFRFYSETLDDLKLERAANETELQRVVILGAWGGLLALANSSPKRGRLLLSEDLPLTVAEMAHKIGIREAELQDIIGAFGTLRMIHWDGETLVITNMSKRQFASDDSTDRVRRWREKQQSNGPEGEGGNDDETLQERSDNDGVTPPEQNRTDTEQNIAEQTISANADYQIIRKSYLELFPDKPKPREKNATLTRKVKTRMNDAHFQENWAPALHRAAQSGFLHSSGFFDLGWFLKNDEHYIKCLNGNYDDRPGQGKSKEPYAGIKEWVAEQEAVI